MNPKYLYLLIKTKLSDESIKKPTISKKSLKSFLNKVLKEKDLEIPLMMKVLKDDQFLKKN